MDWFLLKTFYQYLNLIWPSSCSKKYIHKNEESRFNKCSWYNQKLLTKLCFYRFTRSRFHNEREKDQRSFKIITCENASLRPRNASKNFVWRCLSWKAINCSWQYNFWSNSEFAGLGSRAAYAPHFTSGYSKKFAHGPVSNCLKFRFNSNNSRLI